MTTKSLLLALGLAMTATAVLAKPTVEVRQLPAFSRIESTDITDIEVKVGESQSLSLAADDQQISKIVTEVRGDTLIISMRGEYDSYKTKSSPRATITIPQLKSLSLVGTGNATVTNLQGQDFNLSIVGTGDATIAGSVDKVLVSLSGTGNAKLDSLKVREANVNVTGTGDAKVNVSGILTAAASGTGDIVYVGSPKIVRKSNTGTGNIKATN
jgi:Putative auto-transporter adhesin, head GIN domain